MIYLQGGHTFKTAADVAGSCVPYVAAMVAILQTEDRLLIDGVLRGDLPVLKTAERVKARATVVAGIRQLTPADKIAVGLTVGPAALWDDFVVPCII
jgi:hypothetical protein